MQILTLFCHNELRNFIHILVDPKSRDALCVDPYDAQLVLGCLKRHKLKLKKILNTHEHWDHIRGNEELKSKTGCEIHSVPSVMGSDKILKGGERFVFSDCDLEVVHTPGHTANHICLLATPLGAPPALFSGDMLFNAGVGRCSHGGDVAEMFQTFEKFFQKLSDDVRVYPGHDYILKNLGFAKDREPSNPVVDEMLGRARQVAERDEFIVTSMGEERKFNPFLRLGSGEICQRLELKDDRRQAVFTQLRALRDKW